MAEEYGVALQPLLTRMGLDEAVMRSAELRVSYRQGSAVIRRAVELTRDEHLGLRVGAAQHLTAWGLLGFALMAADSLRDAIATGVRYQNLSGAMTVWSVAEDDDGYALRADLPDPAVDPAVAVFLIEEAFASVVTLTRLSAGIEFAPQSLEFTFSAPQDPHSFATLFGCPIRFLSARNRLVFPAAWLRMSMPGRDPVAFAGTLELLDEQMAARRDQQDLLEVLEISIAQGLPHVPSFVEQARRHASSERTLRRRLAECGTTYEAVVDGVRRERVDRLLRRPELTLRDVASQSGFSDVRALRRAVRRWHGVAPHELRAALLARRPSSEPEGAVRARLSKTAGSV